MKRLLFILALLLLQTGPTTAQPATKSPSLAEVIAAVNTSHDLPLVDSEAGYPHMLRPAAHSLKLARLLADTSLEICLAEASKCAGPPARAWRTMMWQIAQLPREAQANRVNRFFNRYSYISDDRFGPGMDRWLKPSDFLVQGGDCEDYVIAKYLSLRLLGYAQDELLFLALEDRSRKGRRHAVLTLRTASGHLILDSLHSRILPEGHYANYRPLVAFNEIRSWRYPNPTNIAEPLPPLSSR